MDISDKFSYLIFTLPFWVRYWKNDNRKACYMVFIIIGIESLNKDIIPIVNLIILH